MRSIHRARQPPGADPGGGQLSQSYRPARSLDEYASIISSEVQEGPLEVWVAAPPPESGPLSCKGALNAVAQVPGAPPFASLQLHPSFQAPDTGPALHGWPEPNDSGSAGGGGSGGGGSGGVALDHHRATTSSTSIGTWRQRYGVLDIRGGSLDVYVSRECLDYRLFAVAAAASSSASAPSSASAGSLARTLHSSGSLLFGPPAVGVHPPQSSSYAVGGGSSSSSGSASPATVPVPFAPLRRQGSLSSTAILASSGGGLRGSAGGGSGIPGSAASASGSGTPQSMYGFLVQRIPLSSIVSVSTGRSESCDPWKQLPDTSRSDSSGSTDRSVSCDPPLEGVPLLPGTAVEVGGPGADMGGLGGGITHRRGGPSPFNFVLRYMVLQPVGAQAAAAASPASHPGPLQHSTASGRHCAAAAPSESAGAEPLVGLHTGLYPATPEEAPPPAGLGHRSRQQSFFGSPPDSGGSDVSASRGHDITAGPGNGPAVRHRPTQHQQQPGTATERVGPARLAGFTTHPASAGYLLSEPDRVAASRPRLPTSSSAGTQDPSTDGVEEEDYLMAVLATPRPPTDRRERVSYADLAAAAPGSGSAVGEALSALAPQPPPAPEYRGRGRGSRCVDDDDFEEGLGGGSCAGERGATLLHTLRMRCRTQDEAHSWKFGLQKATIYLSTRQTLAVQASLVQQASSPAGLGGSGQQSLPLGHGYPSTNNNAGQLAHSNGLQGSPGQQPSVDGCLKLERQGPPGGVPSAGNGEAPCAAFSATSLKPAALADHRRAGPFFAGVPAYQRLSSAAGNPFPSSSLPAASFMSSAAPAGAFSGGAGGGQAKPALRPFHQPIAGGGLSRAPAFHPSAPEAFPGGVGAPPAAAHSSFRAPSSMFNRVNVLSSLAEEALGEGGGTGSGSGTIRQIGSLPGADDDDSPGAGGGDASPSFSNMHGCQPGNVPPRAHGSNGETEGRRRAPKRPSPQNDPNDTHGTAGGGSGSSGCSALADEGDELLEGIDLFCGGLGLTHALSSGGGHFVPPSVPTGRRSAAGESTVTSASSSSPATTDEGSGSREGSDEEGAGPGNGEDDDAMIGHTGSSSSRGTTEARSSTSRMKGRGPSVSGRYATRASRAHGGSRGSRSCAAINAHAGSLSAHSFATAFPHVSHASGGSRERAKGTGGDSEGALSGFETAVSDGVLSGDGPVSREGEVPESRLRQGARSRDAGSPFHDEDDGCAGDTVDASRPSEKRSRLSLHEADTFPNAAGRASDHAYTANTGRPVDGAFAGSEAASHDTLRGRNDSLDGMPTIFGGLGVQQEACTPDARTIGQAFHAAAAADRTSLSFANLSASSTVLASGVGGVSGGALLAATATSTSAAGPTAVSYSAFASSAPSAAASSVGGSQDSSASVAGAAPSASTSVSGAASAHSKPSSSVSAQGAWVPKWKRAQLEAQAKVAAEASGGASSHEVFLEFASAEGSVPPDSLHPPLIASCFVGTIGLTTTPAASAYDCAPPSCSGDFSGGASVGVVAAGGAFHRTLTYSHAPSLSAALSGADGAVEALASHGAFSSTTTGSSACDAASSLSSSLRSDPGAAAHSGVVQLPSSTGGSRRDTGGGVNTGRGDATWGVWERQGPRKRMEDACVMLGALPCTCHRCVEHAPTAPSSAECVPVVSHGQQHGAGAPSDPDASTRGAPCPPESSSLITPHPCASHPHSPPPSEGAGDASLAGAGTPGSFVRHSLDSTGGFSASHCSSAASLEEAELQQQAGSSHPVPPHPLPTSYFGVFDGHGGRFAADFVADRLHQYLLGHARFDTDLHAALHDAFCRCDEEFLAHSDASKGGASAAAAAAAAAARPAAGAEAAGEGAAAKRGHNGWGTTPCLPPPAGASPTDWLSGTTALVALLRGHYLTTASLGDSRAVLVRSDGSCAQVSVEHSPESERARIEGAGGWVVCESHMSIAKLVSGTDFSDPAVAALLRNRGQRWVEVSRVNADLGVSRSIGDPDFKGAARMNAYPWHWGGRVPRPFTRDLVLAVPDVQTHALVPGVDAFLILACDGLWEVLTSSEAASLASWCLAPPPHGAGGSPSAAARRLADMAVKLGTSDNVTAAVVVLPTAPRELRESAAAAAAAEQA